MTDHAVIEPERADRLLSELVETVPDQRATWLAAQGATAAAASDALLASAERRLARELALVLDASDALAAAAHEAGAGLQSARALRVLSHALAYAGRLDEAVDAADRSRAGALAAGSRIDASRADAASMHALAKAGRPLEAIERGQRARDDLRGVGADALAARTEFNLGNVLRLLGRHAQALALLDAALVTLAADPGVAGQVQNSRGETLLGMGRIAEAEAAFKEARRMLGASRQGFAVGLVTGNLADLHARAGRAALALDLFDEARTALRAEGAMGHVARLDVEEAELLEALGAPEDALESARRAGRALEAASHAWECARAEEVVARSLLALERTEEAEIAAERAAERWARLGNTAQSAVAGLVAAHAAARSGRWDEADRRVAIAARAGEDPIATARALQCAASIAVERGATGALVAAAGAVAAAEALGISPLVADALETRAAASLAAGDDAAAIADAAQSIQVTEALRGSLQAERLRSAAIGRRRGAAATLVRAALRTAAPARAFAAIERTRDRGLLDAMRAETRRAPADASRLRELEARLNDLYAQLARPARPGERRVELDEWREGMRATIEELTALDRGAAPAPAAAHDAADAAGALRAGEVLLAWYTDLERVLCFVIAPGEPLRAIDACATVDAADAVERLGFLLRRPVIPGSHARDARIRRELDACLARLHALLVAPLPAVARTAQLRIVVPHGFLHAVPFHALAAAGAGCELPTAYAPSASAFVQRRRARAASVAGRFTALVVAVPDVFAPQMAQEAEQVARTLRAQGFQTTLLIGEAATASAFVAAAPGAGVIHVATHGRFDAANPRLSGLRFSDRWMSAREFGALPLNGAAVVLSGCETGRTSLGRGHESGGLLRALVESGAAEAIASLWPTHDSASAALMEQLHRGARECRGSGNAAHLAIALHGLQTKACSEAISVVHWAPFAALAS